MTRALALAAVLAAASVAGASARPAPAGFEVQEVTAADIAPSGSIAAPAAPAAWCGGASATDRVPNVVAGNPVHWVYVIPSDGADNLGGLAQVMQGDADQIDAWWRTQDSTRVPRNDVATFPCGAQLDITTLRMSLSSAQLSPLAGRFESIAGALNANGFGSSFTKYAVYYDGPTGDANVCGQGGSNGSGFGLAIVYYRSCVGVSTAAVAAHEFLHTTGAVPGAAPNECGGERSGHTCDSESDIMYPSIGPDALSSKLLDPGRNDYYGHAGGWTDSQDSAWLVRLDGQSPLALNISGTGSVSADVPGLACARKLHDDLERRSAARADRDTRRGREARSLERCLLRKRRLHDRRRARLDGHCPIRSGHLPTGCDGQRSRQRSQLEQRDHVPAALRGVVPVVHSRAPHRDAGEGLEAAFVDRRMQGLKADVQGADERRGERTGDVRSTVVAANPSGSVLRMHDVVVVGAGCAGMRAAIEAFDAGADVALLSKIHPVRSHSGAAEGGINAALGNASEDDPEKHAFDTVKGSDYLGDQDAIEILCQEAPDDVYQLEHWGAVFSRTEDGRIAQRPFGAAGEPRTAYAADITGHVLIHVLYEQVLKRDIPTYEEYFAWKLVVDDGRCQGVIAWDLLRGGLTSIPAKTVILATGGAGRLYTGTTNAYACTGDGMTMALREGVALKDMEMMQFHPDDARADGRAHHRGLPRRGRLPPQREGRALPRPLRAERDGARVPRRHLARGADRDRPGPRAGRQRPPRPPPPRRREDSRAAPRDA